MLQRWEIIENESEISDCLACLWATSLTAAQELHDGQVQGEEVLERLQRERRRSGVKTSLAGVSSSVQS